MSINRIISIITASISIIAIIIGCAVFYDTYLFVHNEFSTLFVSGETDYVKELYSELDKWSADNSTILLHRSSIAVYAYVADHSGLLPVTDRNVLVSSSVAVSGAYMEDGRFTPISADLDPVFFDQSVLPVSYRFCEFLLPLGLSPHPAGNYVTGGDARGLCELFTSRGLNASIVYSPPRSFSDAISAAKKDRVFSASLLGLLISLTLCLTYSLTIAFGTVEKRIRIQYLFGRKPSGILLVSLLQPVMLVTVSSAAAFIILRSLLTLYTAGELLTLVLAGAVFACIISVFAASVSLLFIFTNTRGNV